MFKQQYRRRSGVAPGERRGSHGGRATSLALNARKAVMTDGPDILDPDYGLLRTLLERTIRATCPAWLAADSDDLIQVTIMRLMNLQTRHADANRFQPGYLKRAAHSVLVDEIRRRRRRREVPLDDVTSPDTEPGPTPVINPEQTSAGREIGRAIQRCLASILGDRRLAVTLFLQQHTVPESARLLGWTPKRAENLRYRGLADLRRCLRRKGLTP